MSPFIDGPQFPPTCVVDQFMLKLVSCILSHVLELRRLMSEPNVDYGLDPPNCQHFLGFGWQYNFLRKFCTPVVAPPLGLDDLLDFTPGEAVPPSIQHYRQSFASDVVLVDGIPDLNISQVLPVDATFTMSDLRHA